MSVPQKGFPSMWDIPCRCPRCGWIGTLGEAVDDPEAPEPDNDGCILCPRPGCLAVLEQGGD